MGTTVNYKDLVKSLVENSHFTITVLELPDKFKKKLSQAKHRAGITGKLDFEVKVIPKEDVKVRYGVEKEAYEIGVALRPSRTKEVVQVLGKQEGI